LHSPDSSVLRIFSVSLRPPPIAPLFPYTTLFRSTLRTGAAWRRRVSSFHGRRARRSRRCGTRSVPYGGYSPEPPRVPNASREYRSEEHTSELQSRFDLVCRLLLEKKKKKYWH